MRYEKNQAFPVVATDAVLYPHGDIPDVSLARDVNLSVRACSGGA